MALLLRASFALLLAGWAGCALDRRGLGTEPARDGGSVNARGGASGAIGAAGATGSGGAAGGGAVSTGGTGGAASTGSGGSGMGGGAGEVGTGGGGGGSPGTGGMGGTGGAVPPPNCNAYPGATSFQPATDSKLHCYWLHTETRDWQVSQETCRAEGGHLVTIHSAAENSFVTDLISALDDDRISIGLTDGKAEDDGGGSGPFHWVTGEPFAFTRWGGGEPDGFCDRCSGDPCHCDHRGAMNTSGSWADRWEGTERAFVCEATP